jgi:hypothetical protein
MLAGIKKAVATVSAGVATLTASPALAMVRFAPCLAIHFLGTAIGTSNACLAASLTMYNHLTAGLWVCCSQKFHGHSLAPWK